MRLYSVKFAFLVGLLLGGKIIDLICGEYLVLDHEAKQSLPEEPEDQEDRKILHPGEF